MGGYICPPYIKFKNYKKKQKLKYIGYKRPHPLEKHIIFSVQGQNDNLDELINGVIKVGCVEIVKMLNKIQSELEGTGQFIAELKRL